jgi:FixJ family two-component response regulator
LTDVVMPHMLGRELAAAIKQRVPGIAVLFMSGYAQPVLASRGTLEKGVLLIEKPFTEEALLVKVREALESSTGTWPEDAIAGAPYDGGPDELAPEADGDPSTSTETVMVAPK